MTQNLFYIFSFVCVKIYIYYISLRELSRVVVCVFYNFITVVNIKGGKCNFTSLVLSFSDPYKQPELKMLQDG